MYRPGRYYVGAGSYFLEFPSSQRVILFKSESKQNYDTKGAFTMPTLQGLTS